MCTYSFFFSLFDCSETMGGGREGRREGGREEEEGGREGGRGRGGLRKTARLEKDGWVCNSLRVRNYLHGKKP